MTGSVPIAMACPSSPLLPIAKCGLGRKLDFGRGNVLSLLGSLWQELSGTAPGLVLIIVAVCALSGTWRVLVKEPLDRVFGELEQHKHGKQ